MCGCEQVNLTGVSAFLRMGLGCTMCAGQARFGGQECSDRW